MGTEGKSIAPKNEDQSGRHSTYRELARLTAASGTEGTHHALNVYVIRRDGNDELASQSLAAAPSAAIAISVVKFTSTIDTVSHM